MEKRTGTYENMLYYIIQAFLYIWCIFIFTNILLIFFFSGLISLGTPPNRVTSSLKLPRVENREVFKSLENQTLLTIEIHSFILNISLPIGFGFFISTPKSSTFATHISILYSTSTFCHIILRILTRLRTYNSQVYKAQ